MTQIQAMQKALDAFSPFEGKFLARMRPEDLARLRVTLDNAAAAGAHIIPQYVEKRSVTGKPLIDLAGLRAEIERLAGQERARASIQALPEFARYSAALEEMKSADRALIAAAEVAGIGCTWRRVVSTVSYNLV